MDIRILTSLAREAGKSIMEVYASDDLGVEHKADNSPLTRADKASHELLKVGLARNFPEIPLISEEGKDIPYTERKDWRRFWLVDPLDGTKEFIKRNGEFTVNIALIENGIPTVGVIYAPVLDRMYYNDPQTGAFRRQGEDEPTSISTNNDYSKGLTAVRSRSHAAQAEDEFFSGLDIADTVSMGSSLKFCLVASGEADIYYRAKPTWEWDTAAGHAIVLAAGGQVNVGADPLTYNKRTLLNSDGFIVWGTPELIKKHAH